MLNKRGLEVGWIVGVALVALVIVGAVIIIWGNPLSGSSRELGGITDELSQTQGFDTLINENAVFLNYIFGEVPQFLVDWTSEESAAIVILGIWLLVFLAFGDIMTLFSVFNKPIAWVSAGVLAIIGANLKLISFISVILLTLTSFLGSLAVFVAVGSAFVLFIAFHFGTSAFRRRLIIRRAEDAALRVTAGGKKMASAAGVLGELAKEAEKIGVE